MNISLDVLEKSLYRMINATLLAGILIYNTGKFLGIFEPKGWYIFLCLGVATFVVIVSHIFSRKKLIAILGVAALIVLPIILIGVGKVYTFALTYIKWAMSMPGWKAEWVDGYQIIQIIWLVIFTYAVSYVLERYFKIKIFVAAVLICFLGYCMIAEHEIKYIGVGLDAVYIAMVLIEWTERGWIKERRRTTSMYMLWMLPFMVIYFGLMMKMPVSPEPYDWKYVKKAYNYIQEKISIWVDDMFGEEDEYDLALSGFSVDGNIGDGVVENHTEMMTLETNRKMQTNVYLTGKIFNTFEGLTWKAYQEESPKDRYIDTVETLYAAMKYDPGYLYNYAIKSKVSICYKDLNTDYLFVPLKSASVEDQYNQIEFNVSDGSTFFNENQNYGSLYNVYFYQVNADAELFYDFLEADVVYDEALWKKVLADFKSRTGIELTYQEIDSISERYHQEYLECPDISPEVRKYLDDITAGAKSDVEVLRAIEKELASYTYSQTPGKFPEDVVDGSSFLDYFILESKQGYCTHYATAFTLLARAKGYPARYVQGYCVPMLNERKATVTSSMAHAWPEVYIDDVGWIAFEPTPGYGEIRYTPWTTKRITDTDDYYEEDYYSEEEEMIATPTDVVEDITEEKSDSKIKKVLYVLKRLMIILVIGFVLAIISVRCINKLQYMKKSKDKKYYYKVTRNLKLLGKLGFKMRDTETLTEFLERVKETEQFTVNLDFVQSYEEVIYGDKEIDNQIIATVDEGYEELLIIFKEKSKIKYMWYMLWN